MHTQETALIEAMDIIMGYATPSRTAHKTRMDTEHFAFQFWPDAPHGPTIVAGKFCPMAWDFYGRFEIVWKYGEPTLSVGKYDWQHFFTMTKLHQALQVEKAQPEDIIAILVDLGFEDVSEVASALPPVTAEIVNVQEADLDSSIPF